MGFVIGVLLSMLAMTEGLHQAYLDTGDPNLVMVVRPALSLRASVPSRATRCVSS